MRLRLVDSQERSHAAVPGALKMVLVITLVAQITWQALAPKPAGNAASLDRPLPVEWLRAASLGDGIALSQGMLLFLQAFDNQPGLSIPFRELDYESVVAWLTAALTLDPRGQYPLMMASQLYARVPDEPRQRLMLDFVYREFLRDPNRRWRWLAHAAIVAKHQLKDTGLALTYAEAITRHAGAAQGWARQMRIFILADMGETEAAAVLLGGLLESGEVTEAAEIRFLTERLQQLKPVEKSTSTSESR
jgi:hypothetical protein